MCLFTHVAFGAIAGAISPTPYLAPFLGLASHIGLDVIPHHDIDRMRTEILLAAAAVAAVAIGGALSLKVALGIAFALIPDIENLLWKLGTIRDDQKIFPGHRRLIPHGMVLGKSNLILQFAASAVAIALLIRRSV
ncbi:MAG: hypothetical protein PHD74_01105 [Candidatus Krumholzibacteria bacterium]|nr:hypothetical protein [Candidatus Krumholzibacteria bacterium]